MASVSKLICGLLLVSLAGCATPYDKATVYYERGEYANQVLKQMPDIHSPIVQHGRCTVIVATPGSNTGGQSFCTFALTQENLEILGWNSAKLEYVEIVKLKWTDISAVSIANFGLTRQIQFMEKQRQTGFNATIDEGGYVDRESTQKVFDYAQSRGVKVVDGDGLMKAPQGPVTYIPIVIPR